MSPPSKESIFIREYTSGFQARAGVFFEWGRRKNRKWEMGAVVVQAWSWGILGEMDAGGREVWAAGSVGGRKCGCRMMVPDVVPDVVADDGGAVRNGEFRDDGG